MGVVASLPAQCVISAAKGQKFFAQSHVSFAWTFRLILWAGRRGLYKAATLISFSWSTAKNTSTFLMHVRVPCSPWGMTSISTSRLLQPSKHRPSGLSVWSTLHSFISKLGDRCCDGCDDGRSQPWGLTLASNNFTFIHHYHRRRRCSQSFTEPLTWRRPLELSGWPLSAGWSSHKPTLANFRIAELL